MTRSLPRIHKEASNVNRATGELQMLRAASMIAAVLLIVTLPSCKKRVAPATSTPTSETAPPAPPSEPPTEKIEEAPIPPNVAPESVEDIDDTIKQQNATRGLLRTVYFDFDQYEIRDDQVPVLQANAAWLILSTSCSSRGTPTSATRSSTTSLSVSAGRRRFWII